ncbi:bifunctional UDP-sugar hydrolase/5'-nucleotidase [Arachnia propionica]|uniref:Bifunctional metallophosphatase/5'-nucleotidase n=1 Tax=Arachnia propionica TaxID=1750 RepID=A0A3P1WP01_9ACTN|nr:5'-nucleotidase C-terminal domain-containing protein [Arachnia propionica]RRD48302.1 bifunctional metallophosphatase/5'-nucleotidase [Arachnia propionica]
MSHRLTVLATTDVHGNALNWDYYADRPFEGNEVGLAQLATVVERRRTELGPNNVVLVDNGDTLQGTPLDTYFAQQEPIAETKETHPMAAAFNVMGYDAINLGNHEFNYGFAHLGWWNARLQAPLLGTNVSHPDGSSAGFRRFLSLDRSLGGIPIRIGILGLTTPGSMVWDRHHLEREGVVIEDMVEVARRWVPRLRHEYGCDVVVVLCHAGIGQSSYATGTGIPPENPAADIAAEVPGIDLMVIGHTHQDVPEQFVTCRATGRPVLLTQPRAHAAGLTETTLELEHTDDGWRLLSATALAHPAAGEQAHPRVVAAVQDGHDRTRRHVNQQIAVSPRRMGTEDARWRPTEAIALIQHVQATTVAEALRGTAWADLPVVSLTAPTSRTAAIPEGPVSIRDIAGLYVFDNTLAAVELTGAQLRSHLEHAARYFADLPAGASFDPATMTSATRDGTTIWDYQYDIAHGVDYDIDLRHPVGQRITGLSHPDGRAIADEDRFAVALNHYRLSGAGGYTEVAQAPVLYNNMRDIRQLVVDHAVSHGVDVEFRENWRVVG